MKKILAVLLCTIVGAGLAQTPDTEKLKKDILEQVKKYMEERRNQLMDKLGGMLDEELGLKKKSGKVDQSLKQLKDQLSKAEKEVQRLRTSVIIWQSIKEDEDLYNEAQQIEQSELNDLFKEYIDELNANKDIEGATGFKKLFYRVFEYQQAQSFASTCSYNVACGYSKAGKKKEGLDWLEISMSYGFGNETCQCHGDNFKHIDNDTDLDSIRGEARFKEIMGRFKKSD